MKAVAFWPVLAIAEQICEEILCHWVRRFPLNESIKEGYPLKTRPFWPVVAVALCYLLVGNCRSYAIRCHLLVRLSVPGWTVLDGLHLPVSCRTFC